MGHSWSARRVVASVVGTLLFVASLADVPAQLERWQAWLSAQGLLGRALRDVLAFAVGNGGRWLLAGVGVALVLAVNRVHIIVWRTIRPPVWRRYLEVDEHGIAINELSSWGAGAAPVAPAGRVIVDVTLRPEAQRGHRFDSATGTFSPVFDLRVEFVRKVLAEAGAYFEAYTFDAANSDMGFRYLRVKEFIAQALAPHAIADIDGREKAQGKKNTGSEANLREFGRCLQEWARQLTPDHLDSNYDPATLESLLQPRP